MADASWTPQGGVTREVPVCAADRVRLAEGREPQIREVDTFARYHLHDLVHHAHDVSHITKRVTVASYEADAEAYAAGQPPVSGEMAAAVEGFAGLLENGARVLEVGSGSGRDAMLLAERGLSVRRTDITPAFVRLLRAAGH